MIIVDIIAVGVETNMMIQGNLGLQKMCAEHSLFSTHLTHPSLTYC